MPKTKEIIIDCDPGIDDALALMLALSKEDISIKAVTSVFGNADVSQAYNNILKIFSLCRVRSLPPIGKGAEGSLSGNPYKPRFVHGVDGLGNTNIDTPKLDIKTENAKELIKKILKKQKIDILVTLGPLTNIAKLLIEEPSIKDKIKQIVLMGGAVYTTGNATEEAEFNIYQDPEAAKVVLNSKIPIKLISLDATRKILYTKSMLKQIKYKKDSDISDFIHRMFGFALDYYKKYRKRDGIYLPDVLAMCVALDEKFGKFKRLSIDIDIEKDIGRAFINLKAENKIDFLEDFESKKVFKMFTEGINKFIE